ASSSRAHWLRRLSPAETIQARRRPARGRSIVPARPDRKRHEPEAGGPMAAKCRETNVVPYRQHDDQLAFSKSSCLGINLASFPGITKPPDNLSIPHSRRDSKLSPRRCLEQ